MKYPKRIVLAISIVAALLQLSCTGDIMGPPVIKDPRTYTWTIDTLAYPGSYQTAMQDIWGSSSTDVYVVGHNDQNRGLMWHYDGKQWTDVKLSTVQGGNIQGAIDLSAIDGFSAASVYAVGEKDYDNPNRPPNFLDSSLIIRFDGRQWREENIQRKRWLLSISDTAPNDIWMCGLNGTLYHFNGSQWQRDTVVVSIPPDGEFTLWKVAAVSPSEVYMIGIVNQNSIARNSWYFLIRQQNRWSVVDSFVVQPGHYETKFGQNGLWVSPEGTLYSFGPHILRWTGSSWVKVYETFDALSKMAGTSESNVFAVGDFGKILHYNGVDWYEFKEVRNLNAVYSSVWTDGREVFVVGFFNDGSKTLILHGK